MHRDLISMQCSWREICLSRWRILCQSVHRTGFLTWLCPIRPTLRLRWLIHWCLRCANMSHLVRLTAGRMVCSSTEGLLRRRPHICAEEQCCCLKSAVGRARQWFSSCRRLTLPKWRFCRTMQCWTVSFME